MAANLDEFTREDRTVEKRTRIRKPKKYRKYLNRGSKRPDLMNKRVSPVDPDMKKTDKDDLDLSLRSRYALIADRITLAAKPKTIINVETGQGLDKLPSYVLNHKVNDFYHLYQIIGRFHREVHGVYFKKTLDTINWASAQDYRLVNLINIKLKETRINFEVVLQPYHMNFMGFLALADNLHELESKKEIVELKRSLVDYFKSLNMTFKGIEKAAFQQYKIWKIDLEKAAYLNWDKFEKYLQSYGRIMSNSVSELAGTIKKDEILILLAQVGFYCTLAQKLQVDLIGPYIDVDPELAETYDLIINDEKSEAWDKFSEYLKEAPSSKDTTSLLNRMMGVFLYKIIKDDFLDVYISGSVNPLIHVPELAIRNSGKIRDWVDEYKPEILKMAREKTIEGEIDEYLLNMEIELPEQGEWSNPQDLIRQMAEPGRVPEFFYNPDLVSTSDKTRYENELQSLKDKLKNNEIDKDTYDTSVLKLNVDLGKLSLKDMIRKKVASSYSLNRLLSADMNTRVSTYHGVDDRDFYPVIENYNWTRRYFNASDEKAILAGAKSILGQDWCKYGWVGGAQDAPYRSALDMTIATLDDAKYAGRIEARLYDSLLNKLMKGEASPYSDTLFVEEKTNSQRKQASMENRVATAEVPLSTLIRVAFENPGTRSVLIPIITAASKKKPEAKKAAPKAKEDSKKATPKDKEESKKAAPKDKDDAKKASPKKSTPKSKKRKASGNVITEEDINWV